MNQSRYYRIVEVDRDGKTQLTRMISKRCELERDSELAIIPNPVQNALIINGLSKYAGSYAADISDASGRSIMMIPLKAVADDQFSIDVSGITAGLYTLNLRQNGVAKSLKFIKD